MNTATESTTLERTAIGLVIGQAFAGGFYVGQIRVGTDVFALITPPKAEGEIVMPWNSSTKRVSGAESYCDGLANTRAMAAAGSKLAQWALDLRSGGHDDWHIPSVDELEEMYFNGKPTTGKNSLYGRSGINPSAVQPRHPYTADFPQQTLVGAFQAGGPEAFETEWYWTSTQHASNSGYAWSQYFDGGTQGDGGKSYEGRARAVRSLPI